MMAVIISLICMSANSDNIATWIIWETFWVIVLIYSTRKMVKGEM